MLHLVAAALLVVVVVVARLHSTTWTRVVKTILMPRVNVHGTKTVYPTSPYQERYGVSGSNFTARGRPPRIASSTNRDNITLNRGGRPFALTCAIASNSKSPVHVIRGTGNIRLTIHRGISSSARLAMRYLDRGTLFRRVLGKRGALMLRTSSNGASAS